MLYPRSLVVDCGAGHVAWAVFAMSCRGGPQLAAFHFTPLPPADHDAADRDWLDGVAAAVRAARRAGGGKTCRLILPGGLALTKFVKTASVPAEKRDRIIPFEAAQAIPYPLEEVVWSHLPVADDGRDMELMLAAAKRQPLMELCAAVESAGVTVEQVLPASVALQRAFAITHGDLDAPALVVEIGARTTQVLLAQAGRFALRAVAWGGQSLTEAMAGELRINPARAEALKIEVLTGGAAAVPTEVRAVVERAVNTFASRVRTEVMRSRAQFERQGGAAPTRVYLTGRGAVPEILKTALESGLALPVERYDPWRGIEIADELRARVFAEAGAGATLVGGAARSVSEEERRFGLLPPELTMRRAGRTRRRRLIAAGAIAAAAMLPLIGHFDARERAAQTEMRELAARVDSLRRQRSANEELRARLAETRRQIAALQAVTNARAGWQAFLADVQARLIRTEDVWLEKMQIVRDASEKDAKEGAPVPARRLAFSGRLLDRENPVSKVSRDSHERVRRLLADFGESPFIAAIEGERFDNAMPGILRFDFTAVMNENAPW